MPGAADDPGSRRDPTGRRLAYLPAAILGNGSLLVTLSARGEVERMLWPHVDGPQNVGELRLGVRTDSSFTWLDEEPGSWEQAWEGEHSILRTTVAMADQSAEVVDVVDPDEPVLVRRVELQRGALVVSASPLLEGVDHPAGAYVDPATATVVLYRRRAALAVAVDGTAVRSNVRSVDGEADDVAHVAPLEARLEATHDGAVHVVAAFGASPFEALARARRHVAHAGEAAARRARADERLLSHCAIAATGGSELDRLARRSVLVLEQLTDRATGAIVAAPEMDERFTECGGYGFVWPRDLAYVVLGLLAAGCDAAAKAAVRWLVRVQAPEGLWLHRHWTTGELAPSWGLHQIDETGAVLLTFEAAFDELGDEELDRAVWPAVRRAAELLVAFVDPVSGLPGPSMDLWEQQEGQHAYSAAAVAGGLCCAARAAARHEPAAAARYEAAATDMAGAIDARLWDARLERYVRAVNVAREDASGDPPGSAYDLRLPYRNRRVPSVDAVDVRLDSSLLGLAWPFAPLASTERLRATVAAVGDGLQVPGGGLRRHEGDIYAGGHEWPLVTLWLGLAHRALGDEAECARLVEHVVRRRTGLDLLPEQVHPDGRPAWVLPLGWSHAMLLIASRPELELVERLRSEKRTGDGRGG